MKEFESQSQEEKWTILLSQHSLDLWNQSLFVDGIEKNSDWHDFTLAAYECFRCQLLLIFFPGDVAVVDQRYTDLVQESEDGYLDTIKFFILEITIHSHLDNTGMWLEELVIKDLWNQIPTQYSHSWVSTLNKPHNPSKRTILLQVTQWCLGQLSRDLQIIIRLLLMDQPLLMNVIDCSNRCHQDWSISKEQSQFEWGNLIY